MLGSHIKHKQSAPARLESTSVASVVIEASGVQSFLQSRSNASAGVRPGLNFKTGLGATGAERRRMVVYDTLKRALDIGAVVLTLPVTLPVLAVIGLLVKWSSPGPVLFVQRRYGRGGRKFTLVKFRTMTEDAHETLYDHLDRSFVDADQWARNRKLRHDPRVTRVGRWLRKLSLDELPQLWNVLRGEMSLVGPRPLPVCERHLYGRSFSVYCRVRPGLTGLWQVSGRSDLPYERKAELDTEYVRRRGLALDALLLCRTLGVVVRGRGAY